MTVHQDLAALERLVVANDDLLRLEALIGRFNVFDALDVARSEIRHSNSLAFLLDPAESHGQSQLFLKALLMDLLQSAPSNLRPFSPIELDGVDLRGIEIRREWQNIDVLITCQQPSFVIAIENKVDSGEHSNQLSRYQKAVAASFPGTPALFVFLTLSGSEPSSPAWVTYSYNDIYRVFHRVRETHKGSIGNDVSVFLDHYLSLIGSRFMSDPEIDELCRRIYKNHRRALQLIYDKVGAPASGVLAAIEEELVEDGRWHHFYTTGAYVDFIPKVWLDRLPRVGLDFKEEPRSWLVARLEVYNGKLTFFVEVRRMSDVALRKRIVERLIEEAEKAGFKRRQAGEVRDSYTRICGKELVMEWKDDETPDPVEVRAKVKSRLQALHSKFEALEPALMRVVAARS